MEPPPPRPALTLRHRRQFCAPLSLLVDTETRPCGPAAGETTPLGEEPARRGGTCGSASLPSSARSGDAWAQYSVLEPLGRGAVGVVYHARRHDNRLPVALKVVHIADEEVATVARHEYDLLRQLDSPHIIRALDFFADASQSVLVLEYFDGLTLSASVSRSPRRRLQESIACRLFRVLLEALSYLHGRGLVHRDVKPDNVLVSHSQAELRLIDFHTARSIKTGPGAADSLALGMAGTQLYAAPEVVALGEPALETNDMWAAGLCLYFMLSRRLPRGCGEAPTGDGGVDREACAAPGIEAGLFREPCWGAVSEACKEVLRQCLRVAQWRARPAAAVLLAGAWLQGGGAAAAADDEPSPAPEEFSPVSPALTPGMWSRATTATTFWDDCAKLHSGAGQQQKMGDGSWSPMFRVPLAYQRCV